MAKKEVQKRQRVPGGKFLLQVFVDRDLHKAFKIRCIEGDVSMSVQVEKLIKNFLRAKEA
jgi:hypothetical protein